MLLLIVRFRATLKRAHTPQDDGPAATGRQYRLVCTFAILFVLGGALYTLGSAIGTALYMSSLDPRDVAARLPWVYVCAALANAALALLYDRAVARLGRVPALVGGQLAAGVAFAVAEALLIRGASSHYFLLTVALDAASLLSLTTFFGFASDYFEGRAARRAYTLFGGSIAVGTVLGGEALARFVARAGVEPAVYGFAGLLALNAGLCVWIAHTGRAQLTHEPASDATPEVPVRSLWRDPLVRLAWLAFALGMLLTVVTGFQMQWLAAELPRDALAIFLARFYAWVGGAELVLQFLVVPYLLDALGVVLALTVPPLLLALAALVALALGVSGAAPSALALSAVVNGLRLTLEEALMLPARELLFLPMPQAMRVRAQTFAGAVLSPLARALGGLALLAYVALGGRALPLSAAVVLCAGALALTVRAMRRPLRRALLGALSEPSGHALSLHPRTLVERPSGAARCSLAPDVAALSAEDSRARVAAAEAIQAYAATHGVSRTGRTRLAQLMAVEVERTEGALRARTAAQGERERATADAEVHAQALVLVVLASTLLEPHEADHARWCVVEGNASQQARLVELMDAALPRSAARLVCGPLHRCFVPSRSRA
jgi:hypothetical protein